MMNQLESMKIGMPKMRPMRRPEVRFMSEFSGLG
jgi:hypothetical protein